MTWQVGLESVPGVLALTIGCRTYDKATLSILGLGLRSHEDPLSVVPFRDPLLNDRDS